MKRFLRFFCVILTLSLVFAIPTYAESRASAFFSSYGTDLYKTGRETFEIWFDVSANASAPLMYEIGVSEIEVYSSSDQQTWTLARTFYKEDWSQMTCANTGSHEGYVTYVYATPGLYYRAYITFYARNSTGIGENYIYTEILKM